MSKCRTVLTWDIRFGRANQAVQMMEFCILPKTLQAPPATVHINFYGWYWTHNLKPPVVQIFTILSWSVQSVIVILPLLILRIPLDASTKEHGRTETQRLGVYLYCFRISHTGMFSWYFPFPSLGLSSRCSSLNLCPKPLSIPLNQSEPAYEIRFPDPLRIGYWFHVHL